MVVLCWSSVTNRFLQMAETMSILGPLCNYSQKHPELSAHDALNLLTQLQAQPQHSQFANLNPQHPGHPLNPALQQPQPHQFASPAPPHLNLPQGAQSSNGASPHTLQNVSPAMQNQFLQNHLQGTPQQSHQHLGQAPTSVGMVTTQSQQGTNTSGGGSQGTSANASPNVSNKRRRASAVKVEGDDAAEVNGAAPQNKVKASPRVTGGGGGVKRQKANG